MWKARAPDVAGRSVRVQLICLRTYLDNADLAGRAGHVWWNLTNACHHHQYQLAPTAAELRGWLEETGDVIERLKNTAVVER